MNHCSWTKSCMSPGPFLGLVEGEWFECTDPAHADRPLFCALHAREFQRLNIRNVITEDGESTRNAHASPYLLYPRRMIDKAIADGKETHKGEPTEDALLAREWVAYRPDWKSPKDWYGSFEWCCHWLGLNIEQERNRATSEIDGGLANGILRFRQRLFSEKQHELVMRALGQPVQPAPVVVIAEAAQSENPQLEISW